jgi:formylmethanofuran dehydrogenase subunit E
VVYPCGNICSDMDVDGYMVINPSLYNQHWCSKCAEKITYAQKVIYNGLCFVCLDEIKERDEESLRT